jgi:hypothetical protein
MLIDVTLETKYYLKCHIYAPSSSLLKRRGHIFCKEEEGGGIYFLNETSAEEEGAYIF